MSTSGPASVSIERVAETASTNADLLAWARGVDPAVALPPRALVAERQTAGRGRLGRRWEAAPGASLTFSLAWPLAAGIGLSGLSLAIGTTLADGLDPRPGPGLRIGLKWPNDLWLVGPGEPGRKLAGVLVETVPRDEARVVVIGIGVNLLAQRVESAATGVAWLAEIDDGAAQRPASLPERLVPALAAALQRFEHEGFAAFAAAFSARDLLRGHPVRCSAGTGRAQEGVADGVSANGELLLRTPRGVERIGSGEVSVRLDAESHPAAPRPADAPC